MSCCGIVEKVALVSRNNGEVEGGVLLANCVDKDYIAIDARSGRIVVIFSVDSVMGRGRSHGRGRGRGP